MIDSPSPLKILFKTKEAALPQNLKPNVMPIPSMNLEGIQKIRKNNEKPESYTGGYERK